MHSWPLGSRSKIILGITLPVLLLLYIGPLGNAGKSFVAELARLYSAFANGSAMESIALMATTVLLILALQLPHKRSKVKEHIKCLERRLKAWSDGDLTTLVKEGRTIQQRLPKRSRVNAENESRLARTFANLMFRGKTHAALDLLANSGKGGVLHLDQPANTDDRLWNVHSLS